MNEILFWSAKNGGPPDMLRRRMHRWMHECMGELMHECIDEWINEFIYECKGECMNNRWFKVVFCSADEKLHGMLW